MKVTRKQLRKMMRDEAEVIALNKGSHVLLLSLGLEMLLSGRYEKVANVVKGY